MTPKPQMSTIAQLDKISVKIVKKGAIVPSRRELAQKQIADIRAELGRLNKLVNDLESLMAE